MKKLYTLLVIAAFAVTISAQAPQKMSYQAVIRNSSGALVVNQAVGMRISILQGSATGTVVYSELYNPNPQTNANGLVTVEIGGGTPLTGTFSGINWGAGSYYLKTETDPSGGTSYTITGTSQLLSVPYAMHAKTVESLAAETDPVFNASPAKGITSGNISNWNTAYGWGNHSGLYRPASWVPSWADVTGKPSFAAVATSGSYNDLLNRPVLFDGTWASLTGKPSFATVATSGMFADLLSKPTTLAGYGITDADNSNTNEIQTLSLSGTQLSLSLGGGTVTLPSSGGGDNWGTQVVVTDATLAGNGTTTTPLRIADNGVTSAMIADGAVTTADLANNSVTSIKITDGTVALADLANNSVNGSKIVDGSVGDAEIQDRTIKIGFPANALNHNTGGLISQAYLYGLRWVSNYTESAGLIIPRPTDWDGTSDVTMRLWFYPTTSTAGYVNWFIRPRSWSAGSSISDAASVSGTMVNVNQANILREQLFTIPASTLNPGILWFITVQRYGTGETYRDDLILMAVELSYNALR